MASLRQALRPPVQRQKFCQLGIRARVGTDHPHGEDAQQGL